MAFDQSKAGRPGAERGGRVERIAEARRLLAAALDVLDAQSCWQAAATLDLAIHQVDRELGK